jgi:hypothetical protein
MFIDYIRNFYLRAETNISFNTSSLFYLQLSASETSVCPQPVILHSHHHHHHHHHQANMELGRLLTRSGLSHLEVSLLVRSAILNLTLILPPVLRGCKYISPPTKRTIH